MRYDSLEEAHRIVLKILQLFSSVKIVNLFQLCGVELIRVHIYSKNLTIKLFQKIYPACGFVLF